MFYRRIHREYSDEITQFAWRRNKNVFACVCDNPVCSSLAWQIFQICPFKSPSDFKSLVGFSENWLTHNTFPMDIHNFFDIHHCQTDPHQHVSSLRSLRLFWSPPSPQFSSFRGCSGAPMTSPCPSGGFTPCEAAEKDHLRFNVLQHFCCTK